MSNCTHSAIKGDNYGTTCMICGRHLTGYGEWGEGGGPCRHTPEFNDGTVNYCLYCETERPTPERPTDA